MGTCLVTKLKSEVQNENLLVLGEFKIKTDTIQIETTSGNPIHVRIIDGGTFQDETVEKDVESSRICLLTSESTIGIKSNYTEVLGFNAGNCEFLLSELTYQSSLCYIYNVSSTTKISGDLSDIKNKTFVYFMIPYQRMLTGDISNIHLSAPQFQSSFNGEINLYRCSLIYGNISSLASVYLKKLDVERAPNITGSIDSIASSVASSKNSGETVTITGNGIITYKANGDGTGEDTVIPDGSTKTITFDGQGGYTIS